MQARLLVALLAIAATSCVIGAPPGFGSGEVWTIPLVAPLEDDVLLVPVTINDKGPYLFLIDPDSNASSIDSALVSDLGLYSAQGPEETTEADNRVPTFYADIPKMKAGNLVVSNHKWRIHKVGTYWVGGRRVRGVLGHDIIADSLVFAIDRDAGIVQLAEQGKLSPPAGASKVGFRHFFGRRLATVTVNDTNKYTMNLDLGGRLTRLWPEKLDAAKLPRVPVKGSLVDEYGTVQRISSGAIAAKIEVGQEAVQGLLVVPYGDRRFDKHDIDGSLGQDFFARFQVLANWHEKSVWLTRRTENPLTGATARIKRWGDLFAGCSSPGCVVVSIGEGSTAPGDFGQPSARVPHRDPALFADPGEPPPETEAPSPQEGAPTPELAPDPLGEQVPSGAAPVPPPPLAPRFRVERDSLSNPTVSGQRLEVLLDAVNAQGVSIGLPKIQVVLRGGETSLEGQLDATYARAVNLAILDVSPLGRTCEQGAKCYWIQTKQF